MRVKKVPVGVPTMSLWCRNRSAAKDHLVDHKFAVAFAHGTPRFLKARIGKIGRIRPLPTQAPTKLSARGFPFELGREAHLSPLGKRCGLIKRNVTDRCVQR